MKLPLSLSTVAAENGLRVAIFDADNINVAEITDLDFVDKDRVKLSDLERSTERAVTIATAVNNYDALLGVLIQAVEKSGFSLSGPTDHRAAEDGEPKWVCSAREVISNATSVKPTLRVDAGDDQLEDVEDEDDLPIESTGMGKPKSR